MSITVASADLDAALARVAHAMAPDDSRPILAAVLFEGDTRGFRLVAADNYRLAIADVTRLDASAFGTLVLPRDQVPVLRAFLKVRKRQVELTAEGLHLIATDSYSTVRLRAIDGKFPDYRILLNKKRGDRQVVGINPAFLTDAARSLPKGLPMAVSVPTAKGGLSAAVLVSAEGYSELIMPVRLTESFGSAETVPEPATVAS